jgi:YD repeat-containing protein
MTNPDGGVTQYAYDTRNRMVFLINPFSETTAWTYDAGGRVTRLSYGNGAYCPCDAVGRQVQRTYPDGSQATQAFDAHGNRVSVTDSHGQATRVYDALNRVVQITYPGGKTVQYGFDALGRRAGMTNPDARTARPEELFNGALS